MSTLPTVFISYNPTSAVEQTLAIRLHTIGAVHGFTMLLPERISGTQLVTGETRSRIALSDFFILFSTGKMTKVVEEEIALAYNKLKDRSKIVVIYDKRVGRNLQSTNHTEVFIDTHEDPLTIVTEITKQVKAVQTKKTQGDGLLSSLGAILLVGVGLFALSEMFGEEPKKTYGTRKRKAPKKKRSH